MAQRRQSAHSDVAQALKARLSAGEWEPGTRLPSRARLAAEYGVGEAVVQRAQETLIREGKLEGRAGSGTYVQDRHTPLPLHLDANARFGVRPDTAGQWEPLFGQGRLGTFGFFTRSDGPLLLARPGTAVGDRTSRRLRAVIADADDARLLGLLRTDAVTLVERGDPGPDAEVVVVPGRLWELVLP